MAMAPGCQYRSPRYSYY